MVYTEQDLVRIARRENNNKRKYLVVNRLQGKHIPVKPQEALAMFRALADTLKGKYADEKLLAVGFAETATAVGAAVAAELGTDYMHTTREQIPGAEYLYFSEEHSHAAEQKLVRGDIEDALKKTDRILFIEDEVTTGKTILNIVRLLRGQYSEKIQFSVASVLNGMDEPSLENYQKQGIELFWLVKTNHAAYTGTAESYRGDGRYIVAAEQMEADSFVISGIEYIRMNRHMDARRAVSSAEYAKYCESLYREIVSQTGLDSTQKLLVLGTEEYMYPALYAASRFEMQGKDVRFHATTRSPIAVSTEEDYPFHTRYELKSLYDSGRTTYIYDLQKYDTVVIMTDADGGTAAGIRSLVHALKLCGNGHIILVGRKEQI